MQLKINNEIVDFVLENEKNALDVIKAISDFLAKEEALVTRITIDGKEVNFDEEKLKQLLLENITEINIFAQKKEEVIYDLLLECQRLLNEVKISIKERKFEQKGEIIEILNWIKETIHTISKTGYITNTESNTIISSIEKIIGIFDISEKDINFEMLSSVIDSIVNYIKAVREKVVSFKLPSIEEIETIIEECNNLLPEVSEAFQIGNDKLALDKIGMIINIMEVLTAYLKKNIKSFEEKKQENVRNLYESMNSLLIKIIEAFENMDAVLIGDLFEYELASQLTEYKKIILNK